MRMTGSALSVTMLLGACSAEFPSGKIACEAGTDCPGDQECIPNDAAALRCFTLSESGATMEPDPNDAGEEPGEDAGCVPTAPDPLAIYVSKAGMDTPSCGSDTMPCLSLSKGIAQAASTQSPFVYVGSGEYAERQTLKLHAGLTVMGGWNHIGTRWTRQCVATRAQSVLIQVAEPTGVRASYDGAATLDSLTIRTGITRGRGAPGTSNYGIMAQGASTRLVLVDVISEPSSGTRGADGAAGEPGTAGMGTCAPSTGTAGDQGVAGNGAGAGVFGPEGYAPGAGGAGQTGLAGSAGTAAPQPTPIPCLAPKAMCMEVGFRCVPSMSLGESVGKVGAPGCGGAPGTGGAGGGGGGSSIALFAADATVTVTSGALRSGDGGASGAGGTGGEGGTAAKGERGASGAMCTICSGARLPFPFPFPLPGTTLPPVTASLPTKGSEQLRDSGDDLQIAKPEASSCSEGSGADPGTMGGNGGAGGAGGRGGDGAAGSSFAIYTVGSARVTRSPETVLAHGAPGMVTGNGAAGSAGDVGGGGT